MSNIFKSSAKWCDTPLARMEHELLKHIMYEFYLACVNFLK